MFTSKMLSSDSLNGFVFPLKPTGFPFTTAAKDGCTYWSR